MNNLEQYVLPDGSLDGRRTLSRETLYQGMNGKLVERFFVSPEQSYVFKPRTNEATDDREIWVYQHLLPSFPRVYPQLFASSGPGRGSQSWAIFEDVGRLNHEYSLQHAQQVAKVMAYWHSLPMNLDEIPTTGPKPPIEQIASDILKRSDGDVSAIMQQMGLSDRFLLEDVQLVAEGQAFTERKVLCHGDLHLGNYALPANGQLYILDWEHAHLNLPLWDLYHLIDMSHPLFPKQMTSVQRELILDGYLDGVAVQGSTYVNNRDEFKLDYYRFAAVFSLWMLLLIRADLRQETTLWPKDRLLAQWEETSLSLTECLGRLDEYITKYNYKDKSVNL